MKAVNPDYVITTGVNEDKYFATLDTGGPNI